MAWMHQIVVSNIHMGEATRAGAAGGVVRADSTAVTRAFGGFGISTATATTTTGTATSDTANTTTFATSDNSVTLTWRVDIDTDAATDIPLVIATPEESNATFDTNVGRNVHIQGLTHTSCCLVFHELDNVNVTFGASTADVASVVTGPGPAYVAVLGKFTGTQVT